MKYPLSEAQIERAIEAAYSAFRSAGGLMPHAVVEDMIGLERYRQIMRCPSTETLAAYADDRLPFESALRVATHERRCPVCRADVDDLRSSGHRQIAPLLAAIPAWTTPFVG